MYPTPCGARFVAWISRILRRTSGATQEKTFVVEGLVELAPSFVYGSEIDVTELEVGETQRICRVPRTGDRRAREITPDNRGVGIVEGERQKIGAGPAAEFQDSRHRGSGGRHAEQ